MSPYIRVRARVGWSDGVLCQRVAWEDTEQTEVLFLFKYVYNSLIIYNAFRHGRSDPIRLVAQEMAPILAAAKSGGAY